MTELAARLHRKIVGGVRPHRPLERALWPFRKLVWAIEDKVLWPLSDALRSRRGADGFRERRAWTRLLSRSSLSLPSAKLPSVKLPSAKLPSVRLPSAKLPSVRLPSPRIPSWSLPRLDRIAARIKAPAPGLSGSVLSRGDVRIALATVTVAAGAGVAVAAITGPPGGSVTDTAPSPSVAATPSAVDASSQPLPGSLADAKRTSTLEGVTPDFKSSSKADATASKGAAAAAATVPVNPLEGTNSKPSAIPAALANEAKALQTVRAFAGAFVLYEVGRTGPKVKQTFARTATPSLAKALRDRPPRLPGAASVPRARVQNVVLGKRQGRTIGASVSLLRLGDLSELRLTLTLRRKAWAVSEVRG